MLPDGRRITLGDDAVRIGRLPDCAIALSDSQVSRHHAEVRRADRTASRSSTSTRSTAPTVNGVKVHEHALADGDVISVGETAIRYEES